jgi:cobalt-precorrin-5B (C1)-methyltransferase
MDSKRSFPCGSDLFLFMKKLRSGYTTGACAAAAAKGAMLAFLGRGPVKDVDIPFPDGSRVRFSLSGCEVLHSAGKTAMASVIKDAGDDPDVTNGAMIEASVCANQEKNASEKIIILGGKGVGIVTKPGLAVPVGEPAINPVPRRMIREAVAEALAQDGSELKKRFIITISIPEGEVLALKTLNNRLGIIGGLSVLGTTGIVRPVSAEAWTATISTSMNVASKAGVREIVLSTGRTSERAVQQKFTFPEEALVMMGDYLKFSLEEAQKFRFSRIHIAGMWAKILKGAMEIPQTHVRNGALEVDQAIALLKELGVSQETVRNLNGANTAREIYTRLLALGDRDSILRVCRRARDFCSKTASLPVTVHLVDTSGRIVASV